MITRKLTVWLLVITTLITLTCAFAAPRALSVYVNGQWVGQGIVSEGTTYVPLRAVSRALGAHVSYDQFGSRIDITRPGLVRSQATRRIEPPAQTITGTVYITRTGAKYHRAGCRYLRRSMIPIPVKEAVGQGYTPCSVCQP